MNEKHSKGPWRLDGPDWYGDYNIQPANEELVIGTIVRNGFRSDAETLANAHLASAAFDMLEALKLVQRCAQKQGWHNAYDTEMAAVDAAIAKAEGRS
jgi:hypothetical protein